MESERTPDDHGARSVRRLLLHPTEVVHVSVEHRQRQDLRDVVGVQRSHPSGEAVEPASWWFNASLVAICFAFFGWFWTHGGQTLGMRAWKLRLERDDGGAPQWRDAGRRFAASWVLAFPPGLGLLWGAVDRQGLCWHDRLSGTRIVRINESG